MNPTKIISTEAFNDYSRVRPLYNSATDTHQIDGFQVQFELEVDGIQYAMNYETVERLDSIKAYNGYEMTLKDAWTNKPYPRFFFSSEFLGESDESEEFLSKLKETATELAKDELELWVEEIKEQGLPLDASYKKNNDGDLVIVNE